MSRTSERIALVTGAAGGIGRACLRALAEDGHVVAATDIDVSGLQDLATDIVQSGWPAAHVHELDVSHEGSVQSVFEKIEKEVGPIATLVCCAGIMSGGRGETPSIADTPLTEWERINAVNSRGTFLCVREMLRRRAEVPVPHGRIITFSSAAAQLGGYRGDACYVASKAAILGFTKIAARQAVGLGITVNCIAAGPVETGMFHRAMTPEAIPQLMEKIPIGRIGRPSDVAAAVRYLTSEDAGWVTGATLDVNGGYRMQ